MSGDDEDSYNGWWDILALASLVGFILWIIGTAIYWHFRK